MIVQPGEKLHIIHRQYYEEDARRHFVGTVDKIEGNLVRLTAYLFSLGVATNQFTRRNELRTRIISLETESIIINVLPETATIENIRYDYVSAGHIHVTDGGDWYLDISHL